MVPSILLSRQWWLSQLSQLQVQVMAQILNQTVLRAPQAGHKLAVEDLYRQMVVVPLLLLAIHPVTVEEVVIRRTMIVALAVKGLSGPRLNPRRKRNHVILLVGMVVAVVAMVPRRVRVQMMMTMTRHELLPLVGILFPERTSTV